MICLQIETAYDILFMQSMKKRLAGEGVAAKIRYADVAKRKPAKQVAHLSQAVSLSCQHFLAAY